MAPDRPSLAGGYTGADNLARPFALAAGRAPAHTALVFGDEVVSYGTLLDQVRRVGAGVSALRRDGAPPRVALSLGNRAELPALFFGIVAAGGIVGSTSWANDSPGRTASRMKAKMRITVSSSVGQGSG